MDDEKFISNILYIEYEKKISCVLVYVDIAVMQLCTRKN